MTKKNIFFSFPDRSLLHRTRHINNCKVNETCTECILMMWGFFWSLLVMQKEVFCFDKRDGSGNRRHFTTTITQNPPCSRMVVCRRTSGTGAPCWSSDLPSEIINVELCSLPLFDIIKMTLLCGLFAASRTGVTSGFPLPGCGATRCRNWK